MIIEKLEFVNPVIKTEVLSIIDRLDFNEHNQISLTHLSSAMTDHDKLYYPTGSLYDYNNKTFSHDEFDFNTFNNDFKDLELYQLYLSLQKRYIIGRVRIMRVRSKRSYSVHDDTSKRIHLPIITYPNCYFLFPYDNFLFHMPADDHLYIADTTKYHTFVNCNDKDRIHLVFSVMEI